MPEAVVPETVVASATPVKSEQTKLIESLTERVQTLEAKSDPKPGITTDEIKRERPDWSLWRDGVIPGDAAHPGESVESVGERVDRVLKRAEPLLADGDVALVAHGHVLRILTARYLALPPADGRLFRLDTGTVSALGAEHAEPVILSWNVPPDP